MTTTRTNLTACRTRFGRASWIDRHDADTRVGRLVFEEYSELVEGPTAHHPPHPATLAIRALADASEVLDTDVAVFGSCLGDDLFRQTVVRVLLKSGLSPAESFQDALGALRTFALQRGFRAGITGAATIEPAARLHGAIRVGTDAVDAKVKSERDTSARLGALPFDAEVDIVLRADLRERASLRFLARQQAALVVADQEPEFKSSANSRDRYGFIVFVESNQAFIEIGTCRSECQGRTLALPEGRGYSSTGPTGIISRERVAGFNVAIAEAMKREGSTVFLSERDGEHIVARGSERLKSRVERRSDIIASFKSAFDCSNSH